MKTMPYSSSCNEKKAKESIENLKKFKKWCSISMQVGSNLNFDNRVGPNMSMLVGKKS